MKRQLAIALVCLYASSLFSDGTTWMSQYAAWHAQACTALQARIQHTLAPMPAPPAPRAARLLPPPNDNFADRIALVGASGTVAGDTTTATMEAGEPWHAPYFGTNSIWWSWTAPSDGVFGFDTAGSCINAVLAIYTGANLAALTCWAQSPTRSFSASVAATAGTTYQIAVCGANSAEQGPMQVHYYPQVMSGFFVYLVSTNEYNTPIAAQDGSVCFAPGKTYVAYNVRTNSMGLFTVAVLTYTVYTQGVTIRTKAGTPLLDNAPLPGISNPYMVHDYNGRFLLAYEFSSGRLVLFKVSRRGLRNVAEQTIPGPEVMMSEFAAKDIRLVSMEMNLFAAFPRMSVTAFNKQLRRQLWSLPAGNGTVDNVTSPKEILCRRIDGSYSVVAIVYKKGVALYTQPIPLPPSPAVGLVKTEVNDRAGLLFWTAQNNAAYATNEPVSYVDKKGHVVIDAQNFPGIDAYWGYGASDGKLLYLSRPDGLNTAVIAYKIGNQFIEAGRQSFASFDDVLLTDGMATIALRDANPPPPLNGVVQYDKNLRREKWNNPLTRGDWLDYLGRGVFDRMAFEPAGATTNITVNIFNRSGTLADHTFVY